MCVQIVSEHGPTVRIHLGFRPNLWISSAEAFEKILSSNTHITKVSTLGQQQKKREKVSNRTEMEIKFMFSEDILRLFRQD